MSGSTQLALSATLAELAASRSGAKIKSNATAWASLATLPFWLATFMTGWMGWGELGGSVDVHCNFADVMLRSQNLIHLMLCLQRLVATLMLGFRNLSKPTVEAGEPTRGEKTIVCRLLQPALPKQSS